MKGICMKKKLILLLLLLAMPAAIQSQPTQGLVAYYPFNGNTDDESGNGWNGTGTDLTLIQDRFGNANKAYNFNGSTSSIDFGLVPIPITNFSISVWLNSNEYDRGVVLLNAIPDLGFVLEFLYQNSTLSFEVIQAYEVYNIITVPIAINQWHHIVATCDNDLIKLFVDGVLIASESGPIGTQSNEILSAGFDHVAYDYFYNGDMDDIRIYNRVLMESEILELYHEGGWTGDEKIPVVFIPGIMGSPLYHDEDNNNQLTVDEYIWANKDSIWESDTDEFLNVLEQSINGGSLYNIQPAPIRNDVNNLPFQLTQLPLDTYQNFFNYFQANGYNIDSGNTTPPSNTDLYCFSYDWRKSVTYNGDKLKAFVDDVLLWTGQTKVNIVAHSLGGLVFKQFIKDNQSYKSKIKKAVFAGTPHLGAPKILATMLTGYLYSWKTDLFLNRQTIMNISRNMSSPYQLFPSLNYYDMSISNGTTYNKLELYSYTFKDLEGYPINLGLFNYYKNLTLYNGYTYNSTLITEAENILNGLSNVDLSGIDVINIVGIEKGTIGMVKHWRDINGQDGARLTPNLTGDGTVPLRSAETVNLTKKKADFYVKGVDHSDLYKSNDVNVLVYNLLKDPPEIVLSNLIDTIPPNSYGISRYQILLSCPAVLHAYDSQNNHTGPTSDSTYVQNIPNSQYIPTSLQDTTSEKIIILPKGDTYKIKVNSQGFTSTFDLYLDDIDDGINTYRASFENVPLYSSTIAECNFDTIDNNLQLLVDYDGNGSWDTTIVTILSGINFDNDILPSQYTLFQNFPNPFNPYTTISYQLPEGSNVTLKIFNALGEEMVILVDEYKPRGKYEAEFNAANFPSGIYFYQLHAGNFIQTKKMILLK